METGCGTKVNRGAQMRALVVGSGVIGIEYASMFAALGIAVTLVEKRDRPLEFLDREIVEEVMHQMRDRNVTFRLGEAVAHGGLSFVSGPIPSASPARAAWTRNRPGARRRPRRVDSAGRADCKLN